VPPIVVASGRRAFSPNLAARRLLTVAGFFLSALLARANGPGGGAGTGANVTVSTTSANITLSNGLVTVVIAKATAQILTMTFNGVQASDGGTASNSAFYWQGSDQNGNEEIPSNCTYSLVTDPAGNGGNYCEISLKQTYPNSGATTNDPVDSDFRFSLFRGSTGIYVTEVISRSAAYPAGIANPYSHTLKLNSQWNWLAEDPGPNRAMYSTTDLADGLSGVNFAPKEVTLLTTGTYAGQFDCKYNYAGDLGTINASGWINTNANTGIWLIFPSHEYYNGGPRHPELLSQIQLINQPFNGGHFGFSADLNFAAGETWTKVYGPYLIYMNSVPANTADPQVALFNDAQAQALAEQGAWPYSWFSNAAYVQAAGRGTVTGHLVINDSGNPFASSAGMWVGVIQQPPSTTGVTDFQAWGKTYQYWVKADANGNFAIPHVVAGANYTLFAFGPGAIGLFESQPLTGTAPPISINYPAAPFAVTVAGGNTTGLGNITWTPTRVGATVWEIGQPDRDTLEFFHGPDAWHGDQGTATAPAENWAPFQDFPTDFPNGLTYNVGQSHWANGWYYAQPTILDPVTGNLNGNTWKVFFNLPATPVSGAQASIYMGIAGDYAGPIIVTVNCLVNGGNTSFPTTGAFPGYSSDPMIRMSSHGIFCDLRITFAGSNLHAGLNEIDFNMRKGGYFSNSAMYDYVRLELTGYIPPAPANLTALGGNDLVALYWPAAPGATSYNILRSTTSGSGFTTLASNITGPVAGSTADSAIYTDATAVNGTTYFYVVQSVNPGGASANSTVASATPSASSAPAPSAPSGVSVIVGSTQVTLHWNASAGAAYYTIGRSTSSGGPYLNISGPVTGTTYSDIGLDNAVTYYYVVSAANANGASPNSAEASARPMPVLPAPPVNLQALAGGGNLTLTWTPAVGATSYTVRRATSANGNYTTLTTTDNIASFTDSTAAPVTTYYYTVQATNLAGGGSNSTPVTTTTPPPAPTSLGAIPGNTTVTLGWSASSGASSYVVRRGTSSGNETTTVASGITSTNYLDTGLTNGATYFYVVAAVSPSGTSANSPEASATPFTPGGGVFWINSITAAPQDWDLNNNWSNGVAFPNGTQATAIVNSSITANQTINLSQPITVGSLSIGVANAAFTITGNSGSLTLDNYPGHAALSELPASSGDTISAPITVNGGLNITNNSTHAFNLSGDISGAANGIIVNGNVTFGGTNSFSGGVMVEPNSAALAGSALANNGTWGTGAITFQGGTLQFSGYGGSGSTDWGGCANPFIVPVGQSGTLRLPPRFGYSTPFTSSLTGGGILNVVVDYVRDYFTGNWSAFTGQIIVSARTSSGDFRINNAFGYANASVYLNSGVNFYNINTNNQTIDLGELGGASGALMGAGSNSAANPTWRIGAKNTTSTYAGVIADAGVTAVIKIGTGTLTLTGANTYSGGSTVSAGTLLVNNSIGSGTGTGAVTVANGGLLGGTGDIAGNLFVQPGGGLILGNTGSLTIAGNVALNGNVVVIGAMGLPNGNYALLSYGGSLSGSPLFSYAAPAGANQAATFDTAGAGVITVTVFGPPPAPGNLTTTPGNGNVTLTWDSSPGAASYIVERSTANGSGFAAIASNLSGTTFTDNTAANGMTYDYLIVAKNAAGLSNQSATASVTPAQTFAQWVAASFPGQSDPAIISPTADPDGDGLPNLLEYLFGTNPNSPDAAAAAMSCGVDGNGNFLLTFRLAKNTSGVSYFIQQSPDLVNWTDTHVSASPVSDQGTYTLMQAVVPFSTNPGLFRIQVSTP